jgi:hypothetical protein
MLKYDHVESRLFNWESIRWTAFCVKIVMWSRVVNNFNISYPVCVVGLLVVILSA